MNIHRLNKEMIAIQGFVSQYSKLRRLDTSEATMNDSIDDLPARGNQGENRGLFSTIASLIYRRASLT